MAVNKSGIGNFGLTSRRVSEAVQDYQVAKIAIDR